MRASAGIPKYGQIGRASTNENPFLLSTVFSDRNEWKRMWGHMDCESDVRTCRTKQ